jgi:hypothetical protein
MKQGRRSNQARWQSKKARSECRAKISLSERFAEGTSVSGIDDSTWILAFFWIQGGERGTRFVRIKPASIQSMAKVVKHGSKGQKHLDRFLA